VTGGKLGITEEVAGGVVGAAWGTEVKDKLVGAECGMEGEAGIIVAARGTGEVVEVIWRVVRPLEEVVEPSASASQAVRPPGGMV
jgi:hypothetical protein